MQKKRAWKKQKKKSKKNCDWKKTCQKRHKKGDLKKQKKTSRNTGKQWNQQAMATRNARTNGKNAGDNGKRPAHSAGPDIPRRGSNLLADPTPGPGLGGPTPWLTLPRDLAGGILGGGGVKNRFFFFAFFCFFLEKKRKKATKKQKKSKKKAKKKRKKTIWEDPPFQTRGSPQVSSHLHHLPGWSSQICKVSPKPSQSSCAQAPCHDPRHTLSSASSKSGMTFSAKATPSVFCCFFPIAFFLLFVCFFFAFLLPFCLLFFLLFCLFFLLFFNRFFFCFFQNG